MSLDRVLSHHRFVRLEQIGTPYDLQQTYRITVRGVGDKAIVFEGGIDEATTQAMTALQSLDAIGSEGLGRHLRKSDLSVTQPMASLGARTRPRCPRCPHPAHDGVCDVILTSSTSRSGPDDVGEPCGCGGL